jgi:hypothetical protein
MPGEEVEVHDQLFHVEDLDNLVELAADGHGLEGPGEHVLKEGAKARGSKVGVVA